jgi:RimJ/RimL family protein N-acetyltransferase
MICTIINYAKDVLKLEKLVAGTAEENIPSVKLLHEAGFKVINKELTSFTKDEKGNLITFVGCMFEINL